MAERHEEKKREALAVAWELTAISFRYPTIELARAVCSGEWYQAAREIDQVLGLALPKEFGEDAASRTAKTLSEAAEKRALADLRVEATRLFIGSPQPVVSPYEGIWRANEEGVQALLFVNPHSVAVERFMKACGLGRPEGTNEPLDHIAAECELLEHLALRSIGCFSVESSSLPVSADLPGGSEEAAYDLFLSEHVLAWVCGFSARVAAEARMRFYRDAATLLGALAMSKGL